MLVQLPIPGRAAVRDGVAANVPLAAGYLALAVRRAGLHRRFPIEIVPPCELLHAGDAALVARILRSEPAIVGFSCFLWNVERTFDVVRRLRAVRPGLTIVLGGPEITADNAWVRECADIDYLCFGEGESIFVRFLERFVASDTNHPSKCSASPVSLSEMIQEVDSCAGIHSCTEDPYHEPLCAATLESPYPTGILRMAPDAPLFLETMRGCRYRCRFCYYPRGVRRPSFLPLTDVERFLKWAARRRVREIVLLDPTLDQRPDFTEFLKVFAQTLRGRTRIFGELRAESVTPHIASLLAAAGFEEVEVGLQSVSPEAQRLAGRRVNIARLKAGCQALRDAGVQVRMDLILGLPGDTVESIRAGFDHLETMRDIWTDVQIFHLSVLPGTWFRRHADELGLRFQLRPPYTVLATPTLDTARLMELMCEAQERFGIAFDMPPPPTLPAPKDSPNDDAVVTGSDISLDQLLRRIGRVPLDSAAAEHLIRDALPSSECLAIPFSLTLRSSRFGDARVTDLARRLVRHLLAESPYSTPDIFVVPTARYRDVTPGFAESLRATCYERITYTDRCDSMSAAALTPSAPLAGSKRIVVVLPLLQRRRLGLTWVDSLGSVAAILWTGCNRDGTQPPDENLAAFEQLAEPGRNGELGGNGEPPHSSARLR